MNDVLQALQENKRQLQVNLAEAARRLPLASIASGGGAALSKVGSQAVQALPTSAPAVLAAAAAGLHGAAASQQLEQAAAVQELVQPSAKQQQQQQHGRLHDAIWRLVQGGGASGAGAPPTPAATIAAAADATRRDPGLVVVEYTRGKRRLYRRAAAPAHDAESPQTSGAAAAAAAGGFEVVDDAVRGRQRVRDALADYLLPQGFPASVAPQYSDYMFWRGVQYFFGGGRRSACWCGARRGGECLCCGWE
jgi:hypothetical protein